MTFALHRSGAIADDVRRIARENLAEVLGHLAHPQGLERAVHESRKRLKELRALLRLLRPALGRGFRDLDRCFRDAARHLSSLRDAHALRATCRGLIEREQATVPTEQAEAVLAVLQQGVEQAERTSQSPEAPSVRQARMLLETAASRVEHWPDRIRGRVLWTGLEQTYQAARCGHRRCAERATDVALHQWRKQVKYLWSQVRLCSTAAPAILDPLARQLHDLADGLGDDHDLAVLRGTLEEHRNLGRCEPLRDVIDLLERRRADLLQRALGCGARLFVEDADAFAARMRGYWKCWQRWGDQRAIGELTGLPPLPPRGATSR